MGKLENLLQKMVTRQLGKSAWQLIVQRSLICDGFNQHVESYRAQTIPAVDGDDSGNPIQITNGL